MVVSTGAPDFLIIGTMKSGTTTLHRWLGEQPEIWLPARKEPDYFSSAHDRGPDWYAALFAAAPDVARTGEASVSYTAPEWAERAAALILQEAPGARLVAIVREPVERLRSHYRHEVQRGREARPLDEALADPTAPYVAWSEYDRCLAPYLRGPLRSQTAVVRFEDLVAPPHPAWDDVCTHLGLRHRPAPATAHNVTASKRQYGRLVGALWKTGAFRVAQRAPAPVRRTFRNLLTNDDDRYRRLLASSSSALPAWVLERLATEADRLATTLGVGSLWPTPAEPRAVRHPTGA